MNKEIAQIDKVMNRLEAAQREFDLAQAAINTPGADLPAYHRNSAALRELRNAKSAAKRLAGKAQGVRS